MIPDRSMDSKEFRDHYFLKEELVAFCRQEGLQSTGGKPELNERIEAYLDTGKKLVVKMRVRTSKDGPISKNTTIGKNPICSETARAFFKQYLGDTFTFKVPFMKWIRSHPNDTYGDAIDAYKVIMDELRNNATTIDKQFEYNAYIRDFFADNMGMTLKDAIICWRYKKGLSGHNHYQKSDLVALSVHKNK